MLVLTRKEGQRIRIGDDIEVVVRRVAGHRVTIAIEAPRDVPILRGELERFDTSAEPAARRLGPLAVQPAEPDPYFVVEGRVARSSTQTV